ncbi:hypothetical protein LTR56_016976 [Elasticomyces elasticus]|nr:hypothetical protein LTR22_027393 [Elasticomyces elasticus]KAK3631201.1 hypothetical protein LTR56_016976 [Elasticomyces elasticus]KAK4915336.1 hypothetical protein LTR49_016467 [Elasticomyces elasticus]KAK5753663.1 hypothetical protein LTS12_016300 [Elasticomyces elasticus]
MAVPNLLDIPEQDAERSAFIELDPTGFFIRHPPKPHELSTFITPEDKLFQTIHMGAAVVDHQAWTLVIDGLVERPFALSLELLKQLPSRTVTSVHECFGSPLKLATSALWRVGNVQWTGVPLNALLKLARPLSQAQYVWSEGLDRGAFATVEAARYQKDLPLDKAIQEEVLVAYELNGKLLTKHQGAPVRLVVPGWLGTNSTKWLCKLSLQSSRVPSPFTTVFYNVRDSGSGKMRPVWRTDINSMIVHPAPDAMVPAELHYKGWAWAESDVNAVVVSIDSGQNWTDAVVSARVLFSWQKFTGTLKLPPGINTLMARATSVDGTTQPLTGSRNHCHSVTFTATNDT